LKKDIDTRADIELLIETFYNKLMSDEVVGFIFTEAIELNLETHLPVICDFWESVLLNNPVYKGNVMVKHIELDKKVNLLPEHFDRWVKLFLSTADQYFEGSVKDELVKRTNLIRPLMQFKVESSRDSGFVQ
jgi:hemoglobin